MGLVNANQLPGLFMLRVRILTRDKCFHRLPQLASLASFGVNWPQSV